MLADHAYDSRALGALLADMAAKAGIRANRTRKIATAHDTTAHRQRNRIERCFGKLKHFRRLATRHDRPPSTSSASFNSPPR
ncbi:transposase [Geminicoccus roseus]|uniref:transposase n=1 Tax=Geminicoccus roseus TaxID=404900 RepID=UPI0003FCA7F8